MLLALLKLVLPFMPIRAQVTRWIMAIGSFWVDVNALIFGAANSTRWDIRGVEGLSTRKWYLVISNHQTWVDIVVLQTLFNHRIPFLKFFIKQQLIWFPFLGLAWWAMDMPFMKRNSKSYLARHPEKIGRDLEETRKACEKFKTTPTSVINFIEGTRFTTEKKSRRGSGFVHLLPPRAGGVALALSSMGEMFDAILDVTLVYPEMPPPKFWEMYCGEFRSVIVNVQQRPVEDWMSAGDYTNDRDYRRRFHQWLAEIWQEKDLLIGTLRSDATG
jgi:1-acyl-sn-glycerol-3-phosphate acyltransferase